MNKFAPPPTTSPAPALGKLLHSLTPGARLVRYGLLALAALAACGGATTATGNANNDGDGKITVTISRKCAHKNADGTVTYYAPPCIAGDSLIVTP